MPIPKPLAFAIHEALYPPLRPCMVCGTGHRNKHPFCGYNCADIAWVKAVRRYESEVKDQTAISVPSA